MNKKSLREFWIDAFWGVHTNKEQAEKTAPFHKDEIIHVHEVTSDSVIFTRKDFRIACETARRDANRSSGFESTLEYVIFNNK